MHQVPRAQQSEPLLTTSTPQITQHRLFWMTSKQVFPLCHKWLKLEPSSCPACSAQITGPADAPWARLLICVHADSQDLPIPTLVSAGHRTDVGDYEEGFGEAVGPSVHGSNSSWRLRQDLLNLQWEVLQNKPQWACVSRLKTNVFLGSFN